ncbi:MAG: Six-hairpin glycosidase-like protein [Rhodanobacter sp.]
MFVLAMKVSASTATPPTWNNQLEWHGQTATMTQAPDGAFVLRGPFGERKIGAQTSTVHTASPLFDGLFAMAQDDLQQNSVQAIRDDAFDHGEPIACACFETGAKWHFVWTRDLSYSIDLGLWRFDPERAKTSLLFKLSDVREPSAPAGLYPMQDTGSGGSWPISTDRIVWFLGAQHVHDPAFDEQVRRTLSDTLAQDRLYAFDSAFGLYRGETSFLDWREQSYPEWTANNVTFIAQSFALSTNVLHYQALRLAEHLATAHGDVRAADYRSQADALKRAINQYFWRADRGEYMSYIGGDGMPVEAYDLLGISLAIISGVADPERARQALAHYPTWPAGSPVIWPERADQPIYHNRTIWPFVSAYALRAARAVNDPERIAHELRSLMRGAALAGSNMENFELTTQSVHVDDGKLSGPVVDSPRQLWSVAGYLNMVIEGVFGVSDGSRIEPKLPVSLVPMLFGDKDRISLQLHDFRITLRRPAEIHGNLLVADGDDQQRHGNDIEIQLKAIQIDALPLRADAPLYAPATPPAPTVDANGKQWIVRMPGKGMLYINGQSQHAIDGVASVPRLPTQQCFSVTSVDKSGIESLPSMSVCKGDSASIGGTWPRAWMAPSEGSFQVTLNYANDHGPINTGITATAKQLQVRCDGSGVQNIPIVMPHSVGIQLSTTGMFSAHAGAHCSFELQQGFNMSFLSHFAHYTSGQGGMDGPRNDARIGDLLITPMNATAIKTASKQP